MAKIANRRPYVRENVTQNVALNVSDPGNIAPTIAHIPAPATKVISKEKFAFNRTSYIYIYN